MDFNHYFSNEEIESLLKSWAEGYPRLARLKSIGQSYEGRPLWLLALTNQDTGPDTEKPAVYIDGNIHAVELAGSTTVLHVIDTLLKGYGKDERITRLLDTSTFYAIPRVNPDGAALALAKTPRYIRSGVRPYPLSEELPGLHEQDIDGDGRVLQMRIEDPNGDWKPSKLDPRLMEKRRPDEHNDRYYRLLPEGLIQDYDGFQIKVAPDISGLDFNRNFPFQWRPESEQRGAGDFPASEPEIRAVTTFIAAHPNINFVIAFHTYARMILRPYSVKPDEQMESEDVYLYKKIGQIGTELTGYPNGSVYHDFRFSPNEVTTGGFDDWVYDQFGMFSFTIELWDLASEAGITKGPLSEWYREHPVKHDVAMLRWVEKEAPGGFVDWYPFDHPQLGRVELGGWDWLTTWANPPHKHMQEESAKQIPFMLSLGDMLPRIQIVKTEVKAVGENVWAVRLGIENSGYLPTYTSQQGKSRLASRPITAVLKLPGGAKLAAGKERTEIEALQGRSNKWGTFFDGSPTDNRALLEWVVEAPAGCVMEVIITSERAGKIRKQIELK